VTAIQMIKQGGLLRPANQVDADVLAKIKTGAVVQAEIKQPRNPRFHRKFFAMLGLAFEYWTPGPVTLPDGSAFEAEKSFDRFRKDVLILSGFRTLVVNIKGEARYEAESISFSAMDEGKFHDVYRAVFSTCWQFVLKHIPGMTKELAENTINQMMSFD
jgi:hypothetical protein